MNTQHEELVAFLQSAESFIAGLSDITSTIEWQMEAYTQSVQLMTDLVKKPTMVDGAGRRGCRMCGAIFDLPQGYVVGHHGHCELSPMVKWLERMFITY